MKNKSLALTIVLFVFLSISIYYQLLQTQQVNNEIEIENSRYQNTIDKLEKEVRLMEENFQIAENNKVETKTFLPETVIMNIPKFEQTHNASCESASAHAAIKYFGSSVTENEIIEKIGYSDSPRYFDDEDVLHWGNPQEKFVGDIDGEEVYVDGYGVYNKPIYKAISDIGFSNSVSKTNWRIEELYSYIRRGYPAIVWISNNYETMDVSTMISEDGVENKWMMKEHAVVLRGVDSEKAYIMDVGNGSYYTVTHEKFAKGFANLDNMAVIVIPD